MDYNKEFQKRFSELAREISASNSELAQILDIDRKTLGNYINTDRALPSAENLIKISENAKVNASKDVSVDWLLGLVPHDNPSQDEKMRTVAEYTGLCDVAINYLHTLVSNKNAKAHLDFVNSILSDKNFNRSVVEAVMACHVKSNLNQEWVEIQLNDTESFGVRPELVFGINIKHSVDLYEEVIKKIVEEAQIWRL